MSQLQEMGWLAAHLGWAGLGEWSHVWSTPQGLRPGEEAHRHTLSSYYVPGPTLDTGDTVTKASKHPAVFGGAER